MIQIAIDGPSGAGKSTVAKAVAKQLGIHYVDTGALFRSVGYYVKEQNVDPKNEAAVKALLPQIRLELQYENGTQYVYLNGKKMGDEIRTSEMSSYASAVAQQSAVREFLLRPQQEFAAKNSVIMDGRDIGTVVLPHADVKIFLTASNECRAKRRCDEYLAKGIQANYDDILSDMMMRDRADRTRKIAPAVAAEDAIPFDNSWMTPEECTEKLLRLIRKELGSKSLT